MKYLEDSNSQNFNYKDEVKKKPSAIKFSDLDINTTGRFNVDYNNDQFECFMKSSKTKRLFVFFSAAGRKNTNTIFHRISWSNKLNGVCLYIEDPMYKKIPGLSAGWYYGDEKNSYLLKITNIVKKIAFLRNISNENIIFTGSSSAGYAALYCSNIINGSTSYAYNPQIYLTRSPSYPNFLKNTHLNLAEINDIYDRENIDYISKNKDSKFLIFYNKSSIYDRKHFEEWMKKLGLNSNVGLQTYNGLHFLVQEMDNSNPHTCMGEMDDFIQALIASNLEPNIKKDLLDTSLNRFKHYANQIEDKFYQDLWYNYTKNNFPEYISVDPSFLSTRKYVDFRVDTHPKVFVYRTSFLKLKSSGEYVFYIRKNDTTYSKKFIDEVEKFCSQSKLTLSKNEKFMRIHKSFKTSEEMYNNKLKFINETYYKFKNLYDIEKI